MARSLPLSASALQPVFLARPRPVYRLEMPIAYCCSSVAPFWSVTRMITLHVPPRPVGVPSISPVADRFTPAGSVPLYSDQVYGELPWVAASCTGP